jgi:hypothetical protein
MMETNVSIVHFTGSFLFLCTTVLQMLLLVCFHFEIITSLLFFIALFVHVFKTMFIFSGYLLVFEYGFHLGLNIWYI